MYSYNGQSFRGKDAIKQFLSQNESEREELMRKLREKLVGETNKEKESEAEAVDEDIAEGIVPPDTTDEEVTAVEAWKSKWPQVVPTFFTLAGYGICITLFPIKWWYMETFSGHRLIEVSGWPVV